MRKNVVTTAAIRRVKVWSACVAVCACSFGLFSCDDYDDTDIRNDIENLEDRVAALEEWQQSVNTNIQSLQGLVEALESRDYITGVTPIVEGDEEVGYTITFQNGEPITIKNGENGSTPVIGIAKDTDGTYYWTLGGEALTDEDGNKIYLTGGKGEDGKDAIAPQVRINPTSNEWEISTDGGKTWKSTGVKATGPQGPQGAAGTTGDSIFSGVDTSDPNSVTFTLANGTKITVPCVSTLLEIKAEEEDNTFTVTSSLLSVTGNVVDIRVESENADGTTIVTRAVDTRWTIESSLAGNVMTIVAKPAQAVRYNEQALLKVTVSNADGKVLATGQTVFENKLLGENQKVVSTPDALTDALQDESITYVALEEDVTISSALTVSSEKEIDLNGQTLTASNNIQSSQGGVLTLTNGNIVQTNGSAIYNTTGGTVVLDNIDYQGDGWSCVFNEKNAEDTQIVIRNSTITGGYYALTTNASADPVGTSIITLENSTFTADETALLINIPATVTVTNCVFTSGWQAAFLRGGTYTFTDCTFNLAMDESYNDVPEDHKIGDNWADGNQAEGAALLIGNRCTENSTSYNYPTTVTLRNTKFSVTGTAKSDKITRTAEQTPSVYIWSRVEEGKGTTFNYDDASYNNFQSAGNGLFVGNNGKNLTINGETYSSTSTE